MVKIKSVSLLFCHTTKPWAQWVSQEH